MFKTSIKIQSMNGGDCVKMRGFVDVNGRFIEFLIPKATVHCTKALHWIFYERYIANKLKSAKWERISDVWFKLSMYLSSRVGKDRDRNRERERYRLLLFIYTPYTSSLRSYLSKLNFFTRHNIASLRFDAIVSAADDSYSNWSSEASIKVFIICSHFSLLNLRIGSRR